MFVVAGASLSICSADTAATVDVGSPKLDGPSEVFIDGEKIASVPAAGIRKFAVSPGDHFLEVKSNGRIWDKKVSVPAGTQAAEEVRFAPLGSKSGTSAPAKSVSKTASPAAPLDPQHFNARAPAVFKAKFTTTKGEFIVEVHRDWAPNGADRFYNLVRSGFYREASFFRVLPKFVVQFGIAADPTVQALWTSATIEDDPMVQTNKRGFVTYAKSGAPNSRSTQIFINLADNPTIDKQGMVPFGTVTDGMDVIDSLYSGYGETQMGSMGGHGPLQERLLHEGKCYVDQEFPLLDHITSTLVTDDPLPAVPFASRYLQSRGSRLRTKCAAILRRSVLFGRARLRFSLLHSVVPPFKCTSLTPVLGEYGKSPFSAAHFPGHGFGPIPAPGSFAASAFPVPPERHRSLP